MGLVLGLAPATWAAGQSFPVDDTHVTSQAQVEVLDGGGLGAAGATPRRLPTLALDVIKDFEAWRPRAYNDASRYCTIGYGHLIAKQPCEAIPDELLAYAQPLTVPVGTALLDKDTAIARQAVQQLVRQPLSDQQFGALTSFVFNVGAEKFAGSTMLKYLNNAEYEGAARQFPLWIRSKGVVLDGLITRRVCEAALFEGKLIYGKDGRFHRDECGGAGAAPSGSKLIDIDIGEMR